MNYSKVLLVGRLTRNPELREYDNNKALAYFTIAVNDTKDSTSFIDCKAWDLIAYEAARLTKGMAVAAEGTLRQERWNDKETGKERSKMVVLVTMIADARTGTQKTLDQEQEQQETPQEKMKRLLQEEGLPF